MDLSQFPLWSVDPLMIRYGSSGLRYYSAFYFLAMFWGYLFFHFQMMRGGHGIIPTSRFALWMFIGVMLGARLGHCLFYEPEFYLENPLEILNLTRGGVSSHGATIAIFITLFVYAKRFEYSFLEMADRFSFGCMIAAAMVRFGNFFNSEIVGREYYGPLAIRFERYAALMQREWERANGSLGWVAEPLPRHPVQLYEAAGILAVAGVVWGVDRRLGEGRPRGLLAGIFCCLYFSIRFGVEYFKEFLRFYALEPDPVAHVIRSIPSAGLTLGQWLSIPFVLIGLGLITLALRRRLPAAQLSRFDVDLDDATAAGRSG